MAANGNSTKSSYGTSRQQMSQKECITDVKVRNVSYTWKINHFSFCTKEIMSPVFSVEKNDKTSWEFYMNPKHTDMNGYTYVNFYLAQNSSDKSNIVAQYKFSIIGAKNEEVYARNQSDIFTFTSGQYYGFQDFIDRDILLDKSKGFLQNDTLTFLCELSMVTGIDTTAVQSSVVPFKIPDCELLDDLCTLFDSAEFADVTLVCQGREFKCHKDILKIRSKVFAAMFEHDMKEKKVNRVEINDLSPDAMADMLLFIYTGRTKNLEKRATDLLVAADKYALDRLKVQCEDALYRTLSSDNLLELLILADRHSAKQLKTQAIATINTHGIKLLMKTTEWKEIITSNPHLIEEIICALVHDKISP